MKAIQYNRFGGTEVLELADRELPEPGQSQVRVRVIASGLNPVDTKVRQGVLPHIPVTFPVVPGWDLAGIVDAVGASVEGLAVGTAVLGTTMGTSASEGTAAEFVIVNADELAVKPAGIGWEVAAALPLAGLTAAQLVRAGQVGQGDVVLIHGGAGGVGHLATQLAVAADARVIATASAGKQELLRSLGAEPLVYGEGLVDAVRALAPDGVDVVLDLVGTPEAATTEGVGRPGARLASIGQPAVTQRGGIYVSVHPDAADLATLVDAVEAGSLRVLVSSVLPLADAASAHALVETGAGGTKVVLRVAQE